MEVFWMVVSALSDFNTRRLNGSTCRWTLLLVWLNEASVFSTLWSRPSFRSGMTSLRKCSRNDILNMDISIAICVVVLISLWLPTFHLCIASQAKRCYWRDWLVGLVQLCLERFAFYCNKCLPSCSFSSRDFHIFISAHIWHPSQVDALFHLLDFIASQNLNKKIFFQSPPW